MQGSFTMKLQIQENMQEKDNGMNESAEAEIQMLLRDKKLCTLLEIRKKFFHSQNVTEQKYYIK